MSVDIHPTAIVAKGAELADGVSVGPYSILGAHVHVGPRTQILSHVVIEGHTRIGADCTVRNFSNLGGPPHHTGYKGEPTELIVGDRNLIWEHVTMHIGTPQGGAVTRVGDDGMFMATSHVGHDCTVGDNVILAHSATLGGHVDIGDFVMVSGLAAVHQYCRVWRYSFIGGLAGTFQERIDDTAVTFGHSPPVMEIIDFIRAEAGRPLCLPEREV